MEYKDLSSTESAEPSAAIRARVIEARRIQRERFASSRKTRTNAEMSHGQIKEHCKLDSAGQELLRHAMTNLQLSARAYNRILKVSRTIADLAGSPTIQPRTSWRPSSIGRWIAIFGTSFSRQFLLLAGRAAKTVKANQK